MKKQFTTGEVASFCGVTLRTVINWIKKGRLDAYQLPGTRGDNRIRREALVRFMLDNRLPIPSELTDRVESDAPTMLIVDDDHLMARAIDRVGRKCGYTTHISHNGFTAGRLFAEIRPCFMTLDLQMPHLDGFDILTSLKEDNACVICIISGMGKPLLDKALAIRADYALHKPYNPAQLEALMLSSRA